VDTFFNTYKRLPIDISHGDGMYLCTADGKRYLDLFGGLAVNALGYGHPAVLEAIAAQSKKYIHLSNLYRQSSQNDLARILADASGYRRVFFTNSGTEAIECALKIARRWGGPKGKRECVGFSNAFHGRTYGGLSLTDQAKYRDTFAPFLPDCTVAEFNNRADLGSRVSERTAAVFIELIQGEGGVRPAAPEFVGELTALRERYGFLIVADEIQTGLGRTGRLFAHEHFGFKPDILVLAKPVGGGLPLGAVLGNETVAEVLQPGTHGTTFGGNPVACAAGIAVLNEILNKGLADRARAVGEELKKGLQSLQREFPAKVRDVRGMGLMLGMELAFAGEPVVAALREEKQILLNCTAGTVLRFLPPLVLTREEAAYAVESLRTVLAAFNDDGTR
jgi:acetylornithine/N-succinyldiaminopimelate aminotransferase